MLKPLKIKFEDFNKICNYVICKWSQGSVVSSVTSVWAGESEAHFLAGRFFSYPKGPYQLWGPHS